METIQNMMDELISKNQIIDFYNNNFPDLDDGVHWSRRDIIENLDNIPGLRVTIIKSRDEPKKWIHRWDDHFDWLECPCCSYGDEGEVNIERLEDAPSIYCPQCGQRLEGVE